MNSDTSIDNLTFLTEDSSEITPADWHGDWVLLIFMRWLG
jgi:hypothetical protein